MKHNKLSNLQKALEKEAEAKKVLIPIDFFQRGIYGASFRDGGNYEERIDVLAELYTAAIVCGKRKPTKGFDVVKSNGGTEESKFRVLSESNPKVSANIGTVSSLAVQDKTADRLFLWVYNPTTCQIDLFVIPKEVYLPKGFTVRYSTTQGRYTESCAKYRIDPDRYSPEVAQALLLAELVNLGRKVRVEGVSNAETAAFVRDLIKATESGLLRNL